MKRSIAMILAALLSSAMYAESITVAAAISLKDALTKASEQYKVETGDSVELNWGSSGQLATQILNGAPVDLFISAAEKQIKDLSKAGVLVEATRSIVATNSLVVIVPSESKASPDSVKALADRRVTRIAIGEPESVPAGRYAEQAFDHAGIADAVRDKLILGTNVRQVRDYVERGEVSAGLVYATDAKLAGDKIRVTCTVDAGEHEPIVYPAVVVKTSAKQEAAARFLKYLLSKKGQACLREFGFAPPPEPTTKVIK